MVWVDALRSSIRRIWRLPEYLDSFVIRLLIDLLCWPGSGCCQPHRSRWRSRPRRWRAGSSTP
jgi:hypothetical protein